MTSHGSTPTKFPLMRLPAELRLEVYKNIIPKDMTLAFESPLPTHLWRPINSQPHWTPCFALAYPTPCALAPLHASHTLRSELLHAWHTHVRLFLSYTIPDRDSRFRLQPDSAFSRNLTGTLFDLTRYRNIEIDIHRAAQHNPLYIGNAQGLMHMLEALTSAPAIPRRLRFHIQWSELAPYAFDDTYPINAGLSLFYFGLPLQAYIRDHFPEAEYKSYFKLPSALPENCCFELKGSGVLGMKLRCDVPGCWGQRRRLGPDGKARSARCPHIAAVAASHFIRRTLEGVVAGARVPGRPIFYGFSPV